MPWLVDLQILNFVHNLKKKHLKKENQIEMNESEMSLLLIVMWYIYFFVNCTLINLNKRKLQIKKNHKW